MKTGYSQTTNTNQEPTQPKEDHTTNKTFITVAEVAEILEISKSYAYKIVHRLNEELKAMGYMTIAGRVSRDYFRERTCYQPGSHTVHKSLTPGGQSP